MKIRSASARPSVSWIAVVLLGGAASCAEESGESEPEVATESSAIVNGEIDPGHPATVALTVQGQPFCSGTLITPTVVVAAAHCIHPDIGSPPPEVIEVFFGTDANSGEGVYITVDEGMFHPDWDPTVQSGSGENDISILRLDEPAPVSPMPIGDLPPAGTTLTMVGFGITQAGGQEGGVKRQANVTIDQRIPQQFSAEIAPSGTCNGDSGGTAIWNDDGVEKLVGIHTLSDCKNLMVDERVDFHLEGFIQPFIDAGGSCDADGACGANCEAPDPDCPCAGDSFCTDACGDVASDPDCDPACAAEGTCAEDCPAPDPDCATGTGGGGGSGGGGGQDGQGGEGGGITDDVPDDDGCSCRAAGEPERPSALWVGALGLFLALGRRKSRGRA